MVNFDCPLDCMKVSRELVKHAKFIWVDEGEGDLEGYNWSLAVDMKSEKNCCCHWLTKMSTSFPES